MRCNILLFAVFVVFACTDDDKGTENSDFPSNGSSLIVVKSGSLLQIGSQIWFAENSNAEPRKGNKWCYTYAKQNCDVYGGLYDWEAANNVCPDGYRLPSKKDFDVLLNLGEDKIRELFNASSMFYALLGGQKILDGFDQVLFLSKEDQAYWWTSTDDGVEGHAHMVHYNRFKLFFGTYKKTAGFSVRCIFNGDTMPNNPQTFR